MIKVYVAGKLNDMAINYIQNVNLMMKYALQVRKLGASVFVPCLDLFLGIMSGNFEYSDYFDNNIPWLYASNALFVCPNWRTSKGTREEIKIAVDNNIPVFYNLNDLEKFIKE